MKIRNCDDRVSYIFATVGMILIEIIWGYLCLNTVFLPEIFRKELVYFVSTFFVALISFLIIYWILIKSIKKIYMESKLRESIFEIVTSIVLGYVVYKIFLNEPLMFDAGSFWLPWHTSKQVEIVVIIFAVLVAFQIRQFMKSYSKIEKKVVLYPWYIIIALVSGYAIYQPNFFSSGFNLYHFHAYFNSIYRVLELEPYNEINCGVYGFYGILIAPFVKLFGGTCFSAIFVLALLTFLSVLAYCYILDNMIDSIVVKFVVSIVTIAPLVALFSNIYVQIYPHRFIFVGFVIAYMMWKTKRTSNILWEIIAAVLIIFSIIWNLETGVACLMAYVGGNIVGILQEGSFKSSDCWMQIIKYLLLVPSCLLCAFGLVAVYNYCVSGEFVTIETFLFPILGTTYIDTLNISLPRILSPWMGVCVVFFGGIGLVLKNTSLCGKCEKNNKIIFLAACVIAVAIQMTYYVNRAVYGNLYIVLPLVAIILGYLVQYIIEKEEWRVHSFGSGFYRAISTCILTILICLAVMVPAKYFKLEEERNVNRDVEIIENVIDTLEAEIPEDTPAIGLGIPEIYSLLGWDAGFYGIDISDFGVLSIENQLRVCEWVSKSDDIFVCDSTLQMMINSSGGILDSFYETHKLVSTYTLYSETYSFYTRRQ